MADSNFDRFDAHRNLYVDAIIRHLRTYRHLDVAPEDLIVRVVFRDIGDFSGESGLDISQYAKDMLVDDVRYIDDTSFLLTLSQSNFNFETYDPDDDAAEPPARIPDTQQRIVVRRNNGTAAPYISAYFLSPIKRILERMDKLLSGELSARGMKPLELEESSFFRDMAAYFSPGGKKVC